MIFQLTTFQGVRPALFNFNTSGQPGGYADFDNYTVDEPRARGIEREIPVGKTIALTSGADGSVLAADTQNMSLVNVAADAREPLPQMRRFQVIDLGIGRVALKASNGRYVLASESGVILKDLAGAAPGDARIVPVGQPDARRHDAHVADQPSLPGDQARHSRRRHCFGHGPAAGSKRGCVL